MRGVQITTKQLRVIREEVDKHNVDRVTVTPYRNDGVDYVVVSLFNTGRTFAVDRNGNTT